MMSQIIRLAALCMTFYFTRSAKTWNYITHKDIWQNASGHKCISCLNNGFQTSTRTRTCLLKMSMAANCLLVYANLIISDNHHETSNVLMLPTPQLVQWPNQYHHNCQNWIKTCQKSHIFTPHYHNNTSLSIHQLFLWSSISKTVTRLNCTWISLSQYTQPTRHSQISCCLQLLTIFILHASL